MKDITKISEDYFFHFTNNIDNIVSIMIEGFKPFYCLERLSYIDIKSTQNKSYLEMAFPVVSFCDLPISLQRTHRIRYGKYGIALKKEWGMNNHLTPMVYTNKKAYTSSALKNLIGLYPKIDLQEDDFVTYKNSVSLLLMCFKPYEGYQYNKIKKKFDDEVVRFYDEKEWRYLPLQCDGLKLDLNKDDYKNISVLNTENLKIQEDNHLFFNLYDLHSIYLTEITEIELLLQKLNSKYQPSELSIIRNKIIVDK